MARGPSPEVGSTDPGEHPGSRISTLSLVCYCIVAGGVIVSSSLLVGRLLAYHSSGLRLTLQLTTGAILVATAGYLADPIISWTLRRSRARARAAPVSSAASQWPESESCCVNRGGD